MAKALRRSHFGGASAGEIGTGDDAVRLRGLGEPLGETRLGETLGGSDVRHAGGPSRRQCGGAHGGHFESAGALHNGPLFAGGRGRPPVMGAPAGGGSVAFERCSQAAWRPRARSGGIFADRRGVLERDADRRGVCPRRDIRAADQKCFGSGPLLSHSCAVEEGESRGADRARSRGPLRGFERGRCRSDALRHHHDPPRGECSPTLPNDRSSAALVFQHPPHHPSYCCPRGVQTPLSGVQTSVHLSSRHQQLGHLERIAKPNRLFLLECHAGAAHQRFNRQKRNLPHGRTGFVAVPGDRALAGFTPNSHGCARPCWRAPELRAPGCRQIGGSLGRRFGG